MLRIDSLVQTVDRAFAVGGPREGFDLDGHQSVGGEA